MGVENSSFETAIVVRWSEGEDSEPRRERKQLKGGERKSDESKGERERERVGRELCKREEEREQCEEV